MSNAYSVFQDCVSDAQFRNKSILDIVTKLSEQTALLNRAVSKSVTHCGCVKINARKQCINNQKTIEENKFSLNTHLDGCLCARCKDKVEEEIGDLMFYLASLCETLDINLFNVIEQKTDFLKTFGKYSLL
jgi:hypothetical protein